MNLHELSHLEISNLNNLLLQCDNWSFNKNTQQFFKVFNDTTVIFDLNDFSPFSKQFQAEIIIKMSSLDFSNIKTNDNITWGLSVFEDKNKKYLLLESDSKYKSSLLLIIAVHLGLLE